MNKVLVTGVNGFVGQHLVRELTAQGLQVVGIGGSHGSSSVEGLHDFQVVELLDASAVNAIDFSEISGVIHLAGLAAVRPSFDNPRQYVDTNAGIEINLFEAALKQNVKPRFIIVSSGSLYDAHADLPLVETSAVAASSPYAVSKLTQEELGRYYTNRGFEVIVARPFNHIGPGQNPGFIVPDLTQQLVAVERGEANEIRVGNLDAKRDYTDVRDIARAYRLLLEKGQAGEIYNICSGTSHSGHDILATLITASGTNPEITTDPARMRPSDTPELYGSHQKLTDHTGWQPAIDLAATLADVVADWRSRAT